MTRREREEALLKSYEPHDIDILASALAAAHRREDAIRHAAMTEKHHPLSTILSILDGNTSC